MKHKAALITISILVLIGGALAWFLYGKKAGTSAGAGTGSGTGSTTGGSAKKTSTELSKNADLMPLRIGSGYLNSQAAQLVKDLQTGLNTNFQANLAVDGDFGPQTQSALRGRGLPVVIYWKQWAYITKLPIYVGDQQITITSLN